MYLIFWGDFALTEGGANTDKLMEDLEGIGSNPKDEIIEFSEKPSSKRSRK